MNVHEKLNKAVYTLFQSAVDSVQTMLTKAVQQGTLKLDAQQLNLIISLVSQELNASYSRSSKSFTRVLDEVFVEKKS